MKVILFELPDGSLAVRGLIGAGTLARFNGDRDAALQYILTTLVPLQNPDAINPRIEDVEFPADRDFRDAWKRTPGKIEVDMPKARGVHRDRLRRMRAPLLAKADVDFMLALERGQSTAAVVARKQALRDVTADPRIEAAQTPEELKAVVPDALKEQKL
jgi:hypothetical protein